MVNKIIWIDLIKIGNYFEISVFSGVAADSEIYRETMLNLKAKNKLRPVGEFQGWVVPLGLLRFGTNQYLEEEHRLSFNIHHQCHQLCFCLKEK